MTQLFFLLGGLLAGLAAFGSVRTLGDSIQTRRAAQIRQAAPKSPNGERIGGGTTEVGGAAQESAEGRSEVVVLIPARNEAHTLPLLLSDLADCREAMSGSNSFRTIVINDQSADATVDVASRFDGVEVVNTTQLPQGWCGKPWACWSGVNHLVDSGTPKETVLIFLDADVRLRPEALDAVVNQQRARSGVVSVQPFHRVPTWVEQLSAVFNVVPFMGIAASSNSPTGLFGPLICCRLDEYLTAGGHQSVRDSVVEDLALAKSFRDSGVPIRVLRGAPGVEFRMYPLGFASIVEGWSKNLSSGAGATKFPRLVGTFWWIAAMLSAPLEVLKLFGTQSPDLGATLLGYVAAACTFGVLARRVGSFRWTTIALFPIPMVFFLMVFIRSLWVSRVRKVVQWKGREIQLSPHPIQTPAHAFDT